MARHLLHRHDTDTEIDTQTDTEADAVERDVLREERPSIGHGETPVIGHVERPTLGHEAARQRFGGANPGAVFFGWLVAVGITILLSGILGAIAAAIGETADLTRDDLEGQAGDLGVGAVVALMIVLFIGYLCGGYVAGRMSRFDGARQGMGVWLLGLAVTVIAVGLGALFGSQYDVLERVDLPRVPFSDGELTIGGLAAGVVVLAVTLIGALLGGGIGRRYHDRVDRVAYPS